MTTKRYIVSSDQLRAYGIDYDADLVILVWNDGTTGVLTIKEARLLRAAWEIALTRKVVARNKTVGGRVRVIEMQQLAERTES